MAAELRDALWAAHLSDLHAQLNEFRVVWEGLQGSLRDARENLGVARIDLSNAREELRRVSSGESAVILWQLGTLQESVEDAYEEKRLAKQAVKKWKTVVSGLEKKIAETDLRIENARTTVLLETALHQIGQ